MTNENKNPGHYRYRILALVFLATTINYFDRSIVGVMAPTLQKMFEWTNKDYAAIMVSFKIAYGIGLLFMGGIIDKLGTRTGYTISICFFRNFSRIRAISSRIGPSPELVKYSFGMLASSCRTCSAPATSLSQVFPNRGATQW